jgi:hypothetical protein
VVAADLVQMIMGAAGITLTSDLGDRLPPA